LARRPSRKTLKRKLDKICSGIVRTKGKCEKCGRKNNLQSAHIFSRTYLNTRWDFTNQLCFCPDCHINFAHKQPLLFAEWVKKHLGIDKYNLLKEAHNIIYKPTIADLEIKLKVLQDLT